MRLKSKQIVEIAQDLEAGMKILINREDLEIRTILDWDDMHGDNEIWQEELEKIQYEWSDYVVFTKMESREAFEIMEAFVDEVQDKRMQEDLIKILNRRSPFANFKAEVESSEYIQEWFDFRLNKYIDYVKDQLESEKIEFEG
jgi:hypothetical protein